MRWVVLVVLALPAAATPREPEGALLRRWSEAGPDERRRLAPELERIAAARRFVSARPVRVAFAERTFTLAELFAQVLDPALRTRTEPQSDSDPGLTEIHRDALAALAQLRRVYAPPTPVRSGTLNLLIDYAARALAAKPLPPAVRLRFLLETARGLRELEGRAEPDARTAWLVRHRFVPALLGLAARLGDAKARARLTEAVSLVYMPSILDRRAQARLAPLTKGLESRAILQRFYRQGLLDTAGRVAFARSVALQIRNDASFAAGAPPLVLELFCDPDLPAAERGTLLDAVLGHVANVELLAGAARDLLAAGFGGPPRPLAEYAAQRERKKGGVARPRGRRVFRFLAVVLLKERADAPPRVARVLRADAPYHEPLHGEARRFAGVLVPDATGAHADFLGPSPGLESARDNRLVRRPLERERIAITYFGPRRNEIELCATLPDDASEPVPVRGAGLGDVVALVRDRLALRPGPEERADLVRLLVHLETDEAHALATKQGDAPAAVRELLPLAEGGHEDAARVVLGRIEGLDLAKRERAFAAALAAGLRADVEKLCAHGDPAVAALAGDALLGAGHAGGVPALLAHEDKYARAVGAALALRLTELAGGLRVVPARPVDRTALAETACGAFSKEDGESFVQLGEWVALALRDPEKARERRRKHKSLYLGERRVLGSEFATAYAEGIRAGEAKELWPALIVFLLDPRDPGNGIPDRPLADVLDALAARAGEGAVRRAWIDALAVLACAESGVELHTGFLDLAHARLAKLAGEKTPPAARRKPHVYWPLWAASEAAR